MNRFEFVMTSSEYILRKPGRLMFDIALRKAGLGPEDVWYCGDDPQADVAGAARAGIFPVWYENGTDREYRDRSKETAPPCEYLHILEWHEMIAVLENLRGE